MVVDHAPWKYVDGRYEQTFDDAPIYCPLCGAALVYDWWDTHDGDARYSSLACFGTQPPWLTRLRHAARITWTGGAHYRYELPRQTATARRSFDPKTGRQLPDEEYRR